MAEVVLDGFDKFTGRNVVCIDQENIRMLRVKPEPRDRFLREVSLIECHDDVCSRLNGCRQHMAIILIGQL